MNDKKLHPWIIENQKERKRELPTYLCKKVSKTPVIDGILEPEFWGDIPSTGNFWFAVGSGEARYFTEAKLCWDDEKLYIGFNCVDHNICATYTKRKDPVYTEDVVEVFISPFNTPYRYFEINVNPLNTLFDTLITNKCELEGGAGVHLDLTYFLKGIQTAVNVRGKINDPSAISEGWSVEYAIPFSDFGKTDYNPPKVGTTWRMNLYRIDGMPQTDFYAWSPNYFKFPAFHIPSGFGYLKFVE